MAGLDPAIHDFPFSCTLKAWMPGSSPGMTSPLSNYLSFQNRRMQSTTHLRFSSSRISVSVRNNARGGFAMERINQFSLYELGRRLRMFARHESDTPPLVVVWEHLEAFSAIKEILEGKPFPLGVSKNAAQEVHRLLDGIATSHFKKKGKSDQYQVSFPDPDDPKIPAWQFSLYRTALEKFETVFAAEMRDATTYFVPRRGIYSTSALVDSADDTFPLEIQPFVPSKTKEDWRAAGRCLAFNLLSASGFHVARAVEGTLEIYYQLFSQSPGKILKSWHEYVKALTEISNQTSRPTPALKTLAELSQMKDDFRNPLMHPRVVLTEPDARILFDNGESLIIAMASEIKTVKQTTGGMQPDS